MSEERFWDAAIVVTSIGVATAVVAGNGWSRPFSVVAVAGVAALWGFWGRRVLRDERRSIPFAVALLVMFGLGTYDSPVVSYLLFAVCPALFLTLTLRPAVVAVVIANLTPVLAGVVREGDPRFAREVGAIFVVTALFSVGIGSWITRMMEQSQERLRLIAELDKRNAEVDRLSRLAGAADERSRLAREIHDTLAQGFTSIITLLQAADPELKDERLHLAVTTARENLAESRALVAALSPPSLSGDNSLVDAVRRQAERAGADGTTAEFRLTGEPAALPTRAEVVLLRAAQEALTNVRRHARARHVDVVLGYTAQGARLRVRDDGCGFDPAAPGGFGLDGMRARAAQVGGSLVVTSTPGAGTTVEVEVPR